MNHLASTRSYLSHFILPLNNPEYYAPYNGAIEESQREIKSSLRKKLMQGLLDPGSISPLMQKLRSMT